MKLRSLAVFGVGYVLGAKAGRERYVQIVESVQRASQRLDEARRQRGKPPSRRGESNGLDSYLDETSRN
ncbi:hypothetical protein EV644_10156 [Kribbella orskensis]|uniref:YtxH domain-containing protein n=1 Tax=Kribbella orskensis TaxID=2512216 RepID=A0ABY2BTD3_9ACTN|nr:MULTISPECIES: hypothetical protein [Kribbella]TCM44864.1 hypothetical protein EV648_10716 [Kribbella sp. VKM Ac-2568]TCN44806.1 hypothetical protein EV642_101933 [Kribbella sp. VKM Ac-2500]TCO31416.1 hypothetical protein EV644_10156 [Kribbella orskensis]